MDNICLLNSISNNFNKLLKDCENGNTFLAPVFNTTSDIDALIVLYKIADIICNRRLHPTPSNIMLYQAVVQIINIKCKEYVEQAKTWNKNVEMFISTFDTYVNRTVDNIIESSKV
jgi:hypothetical protein